MSGRAPRYPLNSPRSDWSLLGGGITKETGLREARIAEDVLRLTRAYESVGRRLTPRMHATRDTNDAINFKGAGGRVMRGVRP
jgi:hypothetical protein